MHNPANRRIRTRMYGGVGGEEPRGSPLSRFLGFRSGALVHQGKSGPSVSKVIPPGVFLPTGSAPIVV